MDPGLAARYAALQREHWWFRGRQQVVDGVLDRAVRPGARLLAAGCGPRENLGWLARRGPVVGVEVEPLFGARGRAPFVVGRLEALPFADGAFDAAVALDVLEHLDDDVGGARELARVVRPGGAVVVTVPALRWLWGRHDEVNHHRRRYDAPTLLAALAGAGLRARSWSYFNSLLLPPIAAVRLLRRLRPGDAPESDFAEGPGSGPVNGLLAAVFGLERHLVRRLRLPLGVSLLAVAEVADPRPGDRPGRGAAGAAPRSGAHAPGPRASSDGATSPVSRATT